MSLNEDHSVLFQKEWLETNQLGGYSSGTYSGVRTRRQHGLLIAAVPEGKFVALSALDETIVKGSQRYELGAQQYPGCVSPQGYQFLKSYSRQLFPQFVFEAGGIELRKTICMLPDENTVLLVYEVLQAIRPFNFELKPFAACRYPDQLTQENAELGQMFLFDEDVFRTLNYHGSPELFIQVPNASFLEDRNWYKQFEYLMDHYHGLPFKEDLFTQGHFDVRLKKGDRLGVIISVTDPSKRDAIDLLKKETLRREKLIQQEWHMPTKRLLLAAQQFILKKGDQYRICPGYPYLHWRGRDEMVSLAGLCMYTNQTKEAKNILQRASTKLDEGMLPSYIVDDQPQYLSADVALWFGINVYKYFLATKDKSWVRKMLPVLTNIVEHYKKGTKLNIHADADGLIVAGQDGIAHTWMDAKVNGCYITPRRGKAVEINALWYNMLRIVATLASELNNSKKAKVWEAEALNVQKKFNELFWNEERNFLYDYIEGDYRCDEIRPNQLYAVGLPFSLLDDERAKLVVENVTCHLLTPMGLRTVDHGNRFYSPVYGGGILHREGALHQGTVWAFLAGIYVDSLLRVDPLRGRGEAIRLINSIFVQLDNIALGTLSAIYDGEAFHHPRGEVTAQAMAVGEMIRVIREHNLFPEPKKSNVIKNKPGTKSTSKINS